MNFRAWSIALAIPVVSITALPASASTVVFDEGHGQRFVIAKDGPLDLSAFAAVVRQAGGNAISLGEPLTDATLATADALVISGPFAPLTTEEAAAVVRFLGRGGRVAVMLHIGTPAGGLLHHEGCLRWPWDRRHGPGNGDGPRYQTPEPSRDWTTAPGVVAPAARTEPCTTR